MNTGTPSESADADVTRTKPEDLATRAPSHFLAEGQAIVLPPPPAALRRRWVERAIVQHGLLQSWVEQESQQQQQQQEKETQQEESSQLDPPSETPLDDEQLTGDAGTETSLSNKAKIHPLALASTRLQTEGIDELNRAINLTGLVATGEYFGLTSVVANAALELAAASASNTATAKTTAQEGSSTATATATGDAKSQTPDDPSNHPNKIASPAAATTTQNAQRLASTHVLKRKYQQFAQATTVLRRHRKRLQVGLPLDVKVIQRWAQLRHRWRLVAPEHAKRALPHPVQPTEVVAADVDTGRTNMNDTAPPGKLARRIPRYATLQLRSQPLPMTTSATDPSDMDMDSTSSTTNECCWTDAEPFALPDPELGKLDASSSFDPSKMELLTLQFSLEHHRHEGSTVLLENGKPMAAPTSHTVVACLEPTRMPEQDVPDNRQPPDEQVLFALQHSLLCSKLFESMRRELANDTSQVGQVRDTGVGGTTTSQQIFRNVAWLAPTTGVAPHTVHATGRLDGDRRALQVVHVHEGQICVQLSAEYTLRVQLVPSSSTTTDRGGGSNNNDQSDTTTTPSQSFFSTTQRTQLLLWCKTLLWHAHALYHEHYFEPAAQPPQQEPPPAAPGAESNANATAANSTNGKNDKRASKDSSPHILQSCVHLGTKLFMERNVQECFIEFQRQQKAGGRPPLQVTCLSTSVFSPATQWTLACGTDWQADVVLQGGPRLSVCWWSKEEYRKVDFGSLGPFQLFLQRQLRRLVVVGDS